MAFQEIWVRHRLRVLFRLPLGLNVDDFVNVLSNFADVLHLVLADCIVSRDDLLETVALDALDLRPILNVFDLNIT